MNDFDYDEGFDLRFLSEVNDNRWQNLINFLKNSYLGIMGSRKKPKKLIIIKLNKGTFKTLNLSAGLGPIL